MDLEQACRLCYDAIFQNQPHVVIEGRRYPILETSKTALRYVDIELNGEYFKLMEQNPWKSSQWAEKSRKGSQIVWVFKGQDYFARMVDGQFKILGKKR